MSLTGKPQETEDVVIANDGFFPDLLLSDFIAPYRIPAEYDDSVMINAVRLAIVEVNLRLAAVKSAKITDGFNTLLDVLDAQNDAVIDGLYQLAILYQKAVFSQAKAWMIEQFNAMNRRTSAKTDMPSTDSSDYWSSQYQSAVMTFLSAFGVQDSATIVRDPDQAHIALL